MDGSAALQELADGVRGLTLRRPWAPAVADLGKDVENRGQAPPEAALGALLAVHCGLELDPKGHGACLPEFLRRSGMSETRAASRLFDRWESQHAGYIVAVARVEGWARIVDDVDWHRFGQAWKGRSASTSRGVRVVRERGADGVEHAVAASPWFHGPVGILLGRVVPLRRAIPCQGAQGWWVPPPAVRLEAVRAWLAGS